MLKTILTRSLLLIFFLGVAGSGAMFAQNTCSLALNVSTPIRHNPITAARATAQRKGGKRIFRSVLSDGMPLFNSLPSGKYKISVTKPGYQKTQLDNELDCDSVAEGRTIFVYLWKGSSSQIARMNNVLGQEARPIGIVIGSEDRDEGRLIRPEVSTLPPAPPPPIKPVPKIVNKDVINGSAISLPKPPYPPEAKAVGASGAVHVQVTIDEDGNVISATAVSGHPLLRQAAANAARKAKFRPTLLAGVPVKVSGIIVYNFQ